MKNILEFQKINSKYEVTGNESVTNLLTLIEKNFLNGEKSIAFGSTHYKNSQEKSIILACDFFNKKFPDLKILVISFDQTAGVFSDFFASSIEQNNRVYKFSQNLFFLNWEEVFANNLWPLQLVDDYDMVFWDLPELQSIANKAEILKSSFQLMDSLYLISLKNNKFDDEEFKRSIMHFYKDHGVDIRSILPWQFGSKKRKPRSKISQILYGLFRRG